MSDEKNPNWADSIIQALEKPIDREEKIKSACTHVLRYLNAYKLNVSNFDYLRIRSIANQVMDEIQLHNNERIKHIKETGNIPKFGASHQGLSTETLYRYFLETYGIHFEQLGHIPATKKLAKYLEDRRNPDVRESLDEF